MLKKFIVLSLIFIAGLVTEKTFCMERKRKRDQISQKNHFNKNVKTDSEDQLHSFYSLSEQEGLKLLRNLPRLAKSRLIKDINEILSQRSEYGIFSRLPVEINIEIVSNFHISVLGNKVKSIYDLDKWIKTLPFASASKSIREFCLDPIVKFSLLKKIVQENPQRAIDDLTQAADNGNIEIVETLIKADVYVNGIGTLMLCFPDRKAIAVEKTPLQATVLLDNTEFDQEIAVMPNVRIVKALLNAGENPDHRPNNHESNPTPLILALEHPDMDDESKDQIVLMLLQAGANPNIRCYERMEPALWYAIDNHNTSDIIKHLLDHGANPWLDEDHVKSQESEQNEEDDDTLKELIEKMNDEVKQIIINHSYEKLLFDSVENIDMGTLTQLIEQPNLKLPNFNINAQDKNGYTALMMAVIGIFPEIVKYLLEHQANPSLAAKNGDTALKIAEKLAKNHDQEEDEDNEKIINLLKIYGAQ